MEDISADPVPQGSRPGEMIERVAQAISGGGDPTHILDIHRTRARAAIEAMREPTVAMLEKGWGHTPSSWEEISEAWDEMISEALK